MNGEKMTIVRKLRISSLILSVIVCVYVAILIKRNPAFFSAEGIAEWISSSTLIAIAEFVALYLLKGICFILPSAAINIAAGAVFGFPLSFFVSFIGIFGEFITIFLLGRLFGNEVAIGIEKKYPKIYRVKELTKSSGFNISFVLRTIGIISYDIGSLYLGASGVKFKDFIIGSMLGASVNILLANLFGEYMFEPASWQMWFIVFVKVGLVAIAFFCGTKRNVSKKK